MELVCVYTAATETEALLLKSLLRRADIHADIQPSFSGPPIGGMNPAGGTVSHLLPHGVLVYAGDAKRARELIQHFEPKYRRKKPSWAMLIARFLDFVQGMVIVVIVISPSHFS